MGHELSLPSLTRAVLLLSRSGRRFSDSVLYTDIARIAKIVKNTSEQHAFMPFK